MLPFIISGIVGSFIPTCGTLYIYMWVAIPDLYIVILVFLGDILVGSLSGYLGFTLYSRHESPSASAKIRFYLLSVLIGFFLPIVLALIFVPLINLLY